jgi:hypothetical protein
LREEKAAAEANQRANNLYGRKLLLRQLLQGPLQPPLAPNQLDAGPSVHHPCETQSEPARKSPV